MGQQAQCYTTLIVISHASIQGTDARQLQSTHRKPMIPNSGFIIETVINRCGRTFLVAWLLLSTFIPTPTHANDQSSSELLILASASLSPLKTPDGDGYLDRLYAEWFARAGFRVELQSVPAARGLENANAGLLDGDSGRITMDSTLYPNLLRVPESVVQVVFSGVHLDRTISVDTSAEFRRYRVGYVRGWRIAERFFAGSQSAHAVRDANGLLNMLAAKRIDIAFMTLAPARIMAQEKNLPPLMSTNLKLKKLIFLYLHTRHRDKIPALTDALRAMKTDGSYDRIMNDYVVENR